MGSADLQAAHAAVAEATDASDATQWKMQRCNYLHIITICPQYLGKGGNSTVFCFIPVESNLVVYYCTCELF